MKDSASICLLLVVVSIAGCVTPAARPTETDRRESSLRYPPDWWTPVPDSDAASWEILPQAARPGEVIVSKRNQLGLLSNFAATPFVFHGRRYASLEGFWQMMKYPEGPDDARSTFPGIAWPHTREAVAQMVGFEAKTAGDLANQNMKTMGIDWVSFEGRRMKYRSPEKGEFYTLIAEATREKVRQNPAVRAVLLSTGSLILRPDHRPSEATPPAWRYCELMMEIREELRVGE